MAGLLSFPMVLTSRFNYYTMERQPERNNMFTVSGLEYAENFVREQQEAGADCRWDGWDIVFFRPSETAVTSRYGVYRNGLWGFDNRSEVDESGVWHIDRRNIKRLRRSRA